MAEWVDVIEKLPEIGQVVLAKLRKKNTIGCLDVLRFTGREEGESAWKAPYTIYWYVGDVTHWMALPALPSNGAVATQEASTEVDEKTP